MTENVKNMEKGLEGNEGTSEQREKNPNSPNLELLIQKREEIEARIRTTKAEASYEEKKAKEKNLDDKITTRERSIKEAQDSSIEVRELKKTLEVLEEANEKGLLQEEEINEIEGLKKDLIEAEKKRSEGLDKYNEMMEDPEVYDNVFTEARDQNNEIIVEKEIGKIENGIKNFVKQVRETTWAEDAFYDFRNKQNIEEKEKRAKKIERDLIGEIQRQFPEEYKRTFLEKIKGSAGQYENEMVTLVRKLISNNAEEWEKKLKELYYGKIEKKYKKEAREKFTKFIEEKRNELDELKKIGRGVDAYEKHLTVLHDELDKKRKNAILLYKTMYDIASSEDEKHTEEFSKENKIIKGLNRKIGEMMNEGASDSDEEEWKRLNDRYRRTCWDIQQHGGK